MWKGRIFPRKKARAERIPMSLSGRRTSTNSNAGNSPPQGLVRLVTVSPEWPETPDYIRAVTRTGVVASVGHTKANAEQIQAAVEAGATMSTHLGNGAHLGTPEDRQLHLGPACR